MVAPGVSLRAPNGCFGSRGGFGPRLLPQEKYLLLPQPYRESIGHHRWPAGMRPYLRIGGDSRQTDCRYACAPFVRFRIGCRSTSSSWGASGRASFSPCVCSPPTPSPGFLNPRVWSSDRAALSKRLVSG